jgi:hypothetical protein
MGNSSSSHTTCRGSNSGAFDPATGVRDTVPRPFLSAGTGA